MDEPWVTSGSARLAVSDTGQGPAVVLLHPGVADRRCWIALTGALAPSWRVISYDRRGFGQTTYDAERHRPTDDLAAVLDACGVEQAVLVGNSQGGRVAAGAAVAWPERFTGLVLIGAAVAGAPVTGDDAADVEALFEDLDRLEELGDLDAVNAMEARIWLDGPSRPEGAVGGAARALFLDMNGVALRAGPTGDEADPAGPPTWERLKELAMPVLAAAGRHDLPLLVARMRAVADLVPQGQFALLEDSAHLPQLDDPDALVAVLRPFLDATTG